MDEPRARDRDRSAQLLLGAALGALVVRFLVAGGSSLTYNEATYVELAAHPWWSAYYPDAVFVRHPPVAFVAMWAWTTVLGSGEWVVRALALLVTAGGVVVAWDAARRAGGPRAAAWVAIVLGLAFPVHAYALQASMYPFAFLFASAIVWARLAARPWLEGWACAALALTHLFGFLFLGLWVLSDRRAWRRALVVIAPVAAWVVGAIVMGLVLNVEGDVMRLGPLGQVLRTMATAEKAVAVSPLVHVTSALLAVWTLNPVLLRKGWDVRRSYPAWTWIVVFLMLYFFIAAPFPRYALIPLPFVAVVGAIRAAGVASDAVPHADPAPGPGGGAARRTAILLAVVAVTSLPFGFLYLTEGPDPRAAGDVPGLQDWRAAVAAMPPGATVATSGPTATAYYLEAAGWRVVDRGEAPYSIGLARDGANVTVVRIDAPADLDSGVADVWLVPSHWDRAAGRLTARGLERCDHVDGLFVFAVACPA